MSVAQMRSDGKPADGLEDRRPVQFAMVEKTVLRDPTLSPQAKALYGLLITYGPDDIFPGHERLAAELATSDRSVRRWLVELREHGLIAWRRRGSTSNLYTILGPDYVDRTPVSDQSGHQCPTI